MATESPQNPSFRRLYLRPDSPLPDGPQFRRRLATIVPTRFFPSFEDQGRLGTYMASAFGIDVPHWESPGGRAYRFEQHFLNAHVHDVLESITAIFQVLAGSGSRANPGDRWLDAIRDIFADEHLAYRVDDLGVVHPLVDQAFDAARVSAIGALAGETFNAARTHFDDAIASLEEDDTRGAVGNCFDAAENLFKLLTESGQQLTKGNVESTLRPIMNRLHADLDPATRQHVGRMVSSFGAWVDAGHPYRHAQGNTEVQAPTQVLAVLYLNSGAGFIRWLAHVFVKLHV